MASKSPSKYVQAISKSGLTIYDAVVVGDPALWIPSPELEDLLNFALKGVSLAGLPLRTRSKVLKTKVCEALGYPVPNSFAKTQPRFPGQNFDTYIQKSNNLQVWNEELSPTRRYVILKLTASDVIKSVRVVTGDTLAMLDTTGTLTQKYQARLTSGIDEQILISDLDTDNLKPFVQTANKSLEDPTAHPDEKSLLPIDVLFERLTSVVGQSFENLGSDQERNRGGALHKLATKALGYKVHKDNGQFPDVPNQLLEVKLQTSPTIDLGLVSPDSEDVLDVPMIAGKQICHRDVRYAIFHGEQKNGTVTIRGLSLVTGADFFSKFPRFEGKVLNKKLQIPLPKDFFQATPNEE